MFKSEIQKTYEQHAGGEKHRATRPEYIYGPDGEFEVYAVCIRSDLPDVVYRLSYPTARRWADGQVARIPWTEDRLRDGLSRTMRQIRDIYGGEWILDIHYRRPPIIRSGRTPGARAVAEQRILAGPDMPGRRFLERQRAEGGAGQRIIPILAGAVT